MDEPVTVTNEGKEWSAMDLFDLENAVKRGEAISRIAAFLQRREDEVMRKIAELQLIHPGEGGSGSPRAISSE